MKTLWDFLNNQSVGAALGAIFAFSFLQIGERLGRWNAKATLKKRVEILLVTISSKRDVIDGELEGLHSGRIGGGPIMRFPGYIFRDLQSAALRSMSADEALAYDALIYWMEAIDGLLSRASQECEEIVSALQKHNIPFGKLTAELERARDYYGDAKNNLVFLEQFARAILRGDFKRIQTTPIRRG